MEEKIIIETTDTCQPEAEQPKTEQPVTEQPVSPARNVCGLIGMIAGIVGLCLCWYPFVNLINPIAGLILSHIGKRHQNPKFAKAGWIMSLIGIIISVTWIIIFVIILLTEDSIKSNYYYY